MCDCGCDFILLKVLHRTEKRLGWPANGAEHLKNVNFDGPGLRHWSFDGKSVATCAPEESAHVAAPQPPVVSLTTHGDRRTGRAQFLANLRSSSRVEVKIITGFPRGQT